MNNSKRKRVPRTGRVVVFSISAASVAIAWAVLTHEYPDARLFVATPASTLAYVAANANELVAGTLTTLAEAVAGLLLALITSFFTFALVTRFPTTSNIVIPLTVVSQVIPMITLAPLFVITLGPGAASKIVMAALISFFPVTIALTRSYYNTPAAIRDFIHLYRPSWRYQFVRLHIPLAVPMLMAAFRIAATLALVGALVAEMAGAHIGLGKNLFLATRRLEPELLMASTGLVCLLGAGLYGTVLVVEQLLRKRHYTEPA